MTNNEIFGRPIPLKEAEQECRGYTVGVKHSGLLYSELAAVPTV